jgi:hypothetical protein
MVRAFKNHTSAAEITGWLSHTSGPLHDRIIYFTDYFIVILFYFIKNTETLVDPFNYIDLK